MNTNEGYQTTFLGEHLEVPLPKPDSKLKQDFAPVIGNDDFLLTYPHYSVALSKTRKLPFFAAVNIDGNLFKSIKRQDLFSGSDVWSVDDRAAEYQWGNDLYLATGSDFDKGHMVKREDPQWGSNKKTAVQAARSTFYFSNCAPQVGDLNRKEWRSLEDYILKKESAANKLKICVFTGPVLDPEDPVFVTDVKGERVQIPTLFWKLVYFTTDDKTLSRVGFLMGQKNLLLKRNIAKPYESELEAVVVKPKVFDDYDDAATYQVNVDVIEKLTGFAFPKAKDTYKDTRSIKIVLKQVEISDLESFPGTGGSDDDLDFTLEGLVL
ncbi:MAG: DNA/RNA non-specific endonuclease [Lewinellaceae bacterium]|nr:DNA/RNA non-specific endonuclease [Saprospiraceae bacterium]MCB9308047.1 DNA/RNA non-specific endonuclease [Lewinellaceae bacterium]MCB9353794.1 DNA/RNA non-specific endonuclease [Lewinellaceae bacterium]